MRTKALRRSPSSAQPQCGSAWKDLASASTRTPELLDRNSKDLYRPYGIGIQAVNKVLLLPRPPRSIWE